MPIFYRPTLPLVTIQAVATLAWQVGQVVTVAAIPKARNPSYCVTLDIGPGAGTQVSCGQFVHHYSPTSLQGKQLLGITNFAPRRIAGIKSTMLMLGFPDAPGSKQAIALSPTVPVAHGVTLLLGAERPHAWGGVDFAHFLKMEVKAGTLQALVPAKGHCVATVSLGGDVIAHALVPGMLTEKQLQGSLGLQVAVLLNLAPTSMGGEVFTSLVFALPADGTEVELALVAATKPVPAGASLF